jgi:uncharacterized phage protein (TIGR02218 family)
MKTISTSLQAHLNGETTTLATCWKITRVDSTVYRFTDHDRDLVVSGTNFLSALSYSASAVETTQGMNVDSVDVTGVLDSSSITEADLIAGKWDHATVEIFMLNWASPDMGQVKLRKGTLGEVKTGQNKFEAELRGLFQAFQTQIIEVSTPVCRARLFDARCMVNCMTYTRSGAVSSATGYDTFTSTNVATTAEWFDNGRVYWRTGANSGTAKEIKTQTSSGAVTLVEPMPYALAIGDVFEIQAGCRKRFIDDCKTKFNNVVNFRGEPHRPTVDKVAIGP